VERIRTLSAAIRHEMNSGRIAPCDPRQVAQHLFHALIGHFVAEAIAGSSSAPRAGDDSFLVHLVDAIAGGLEHRTQGGAAPGSRPNGGRAP
jgi:hypothetical protein